MTNDPTRKDNPQQNPQQQHNPQQNNPQPQRGQQQSERHPGHDADDASRKRPSQGKNDLEREQQDERDRQKRAS